MHRYMGKYIYTGYLIATHFKSNKSVGYQVFGQSKVHGKVVDLSDEESHRFLHKYLKKKKTELFIDNFMLVGYLSIFLKAGKVAIIID